MMDETGWQPVLLSAHKTDRLPELSFLYIECEEKMPPASHTEISFPQLPQRIIHWRDSASIDFAMFAGITDFSRLLTQ